MFERTCSTDRVIAYITWAATAGLFTLAALLLAHDWWVWGLFVAEVACGLSAFAAVLQIRDYAIRTCELVRSCSQVQSVEPHVPLQRVH